MYFRRGPIGLVVISILVLGFFMQMADGSDMDPMVIILIACFGCPLLSIIIYAAFENKKTIKHQEEISEKERLKYQQFTDDYLRNKLNSNSGVDHYFNDFDYNELDDNNDDDIV